MLFLAFRRQEREGGWERRQARGMWEREGKQRKRGQEAGRRSGQGTTLLLHVASQDESEDTSPLAEAAPGWVHSFMRRAWTWPLPLAVQGALLQAPFCAAAHAVYLDALRKHIGLPMCQFPCSHVAFLWIYHSWNSHFSLPPHVPRPYCLGPHGVRSSLSALAAHQQMLRQSVPSL